MNVKMDIKDIYIKEIDSKLANRLIIQNHYSGTVPKGVKYHLGIFIDNTLYGVAQFGFGIRPQDTCKWVEGTTKDEYLELNRLWISDKLGKNAESNAISKALKWIKEHKPNIKWIISFADGMMGKVGTIYQATNFIYTGFSTTSNGMWLSKEGIRMHNISLWHKHGKTDRKLLESIYGTPLYLVRGGQYRYFYFYDRKLIPNLITPPLPYPKQSDLRNHLIIKSDYNDKSDNWDAFVELLHKPKPKEENKWFTYEKILGTE
jgi:hypothetical protein